MPNYLKRNKNIDKNKISVVILCGGKGTRLHEETTVIPKPLVKIGLKPILWHIMKIYSAYGFNNFILPIGYKGEKIKEYFTQYHILNSDFTVAINNNSVDIKFENKTKEKWKVTIIDTGIEAQSGARIKRIEKFILGDTFMVTYGDGVADININQLLAFHFKQKRIGTVSGVRPPVRFGNLIAKGNIVEEFKGKIQVKSTYIDGGFFVFNKRIFKYFKSGDSLSLEKDVLPLITVKKQLSVFKHDGYWQCMDTIRDVEFLEAEWKTGQAKWKVW